MLQLADLSASTLRRLDNVIPAAMYSSTMETFRLLTAVFAATASKPRGQHIVTILADLRGITVLLAGHQDDAID
jgi:hypothetical protein